MNPEVENIIKRVHNLYKRFGIKSVTMDDIARELGLSKKTLYQYFKDKNELVKTVFEYELQHKQTCFHSFKNADLNAIEELFDVNKYIVDLLKEFNPATDYDLKKYYPEIFNHRFDAGKETMYTGVLENLKKGIKENLYRKEINPEIIAKLHVSKILGMFENRIFTIEDFTSPKVIKEIFIYHIRGIANGNGIVELERQIKKYKI